MILGRGKKLRKVPYWKWRVAQDQAIRQLRYVQLALQKARLDYHGLPPEYRDPTGAEFIRQLEIQLIKGTEELDSIKGWRDQGRVGRNNIRSRLLLALYGWAVPKL